VPLENENLILLHLVNGNVASSFFQLDNEKICIYQVNGKGMKKERDKGPDDEKEEKSGRSLEQKLEEPIGCLCILNVKTSSSVPVCVPFVFYCNSLLYEEVFILF
jgi:hypothetical protein